ncbi:MAG: outer membrane lipoprotein-sorting protein [Thiobacillaceae bacterium]
MMNRSFLIVCGLMVSITATASSHITRPSKLSAAQIVEHNVAARGGLKAWRAVNTLVLAGQLEAGGKKNTDLPFVMDMKRPHKSRLEIVFEDQTALQVYDGSKGWKIMPFLGRDEVEPFTPDEAKLAANWAELDGPLVDYASKGTRIKLQGKEAVEGHDAYKLLLTMRDGVQRHVWIDAKTFLELKIDGDPHRLDGKIRNVAIYYRDYRAEHGLMIPHTLETVIEGGLKSHKMNIEQVMVNRPLGDTLFAKPQLALAATSGQ